MIVQQHLAFSHHTPHFACGRPARHDHIEFVRYCRFRRRRLQLQRPLRSQQPSAARTTHELQRSILQVLSDQRRQCFALRRSDGGNAGERQKRQAIQAGSQMHELRMQPIAVLIRDALICDAVAQRAHGGACVITRFEMQHFQQATLPCPQLRFAQRSTIPREAYSTSARQQRQRIDCGYSALPCRPTFAGRVVARHVLARLTQRRAHAWRDQGNRSRGREGVRQKSPPGRR